MTRLSQATAVALALSCVALAAWFVWPTLSPGEILGAAQTDTLRAVWGLDHAWRGLPLPFWSERLAFPVGVKLVVLPQASAVIGGPLTAMFGPILGYNLWLLGLWAASGFASALLAWRLSGSPSGGLLAGIGIMCQPMTFMALSDGTAEFVAWWAVPLALLAVYEAGTLPVYERVAQRRWGIAAGVLLGLVAVDSPYHAVFCAPFVPLVFGWKRWRRSGWMVLAIIGMGAVLLGLYYGLPLAAPNSNAPANAVSLRVWQQWETEAMVRPWDYTLGTGFVPWRVLVGALILAALRPTKSIGWVLVAVLSLVWSLNLNADNAAWLRQKWGSSGASLADAVTWFNTHASPPIVRFPRRWLIPMAQGLAIAAAFGLSRFPREWMRLAVAIPACLLMVDHTDRLAKFRDNYPHFEPPQPTFAKFIADSEVDGAVLYLPRQRGANQAAGRTELPVFAELSRTISSADLLWFQVLTGRASVYWPDGLRTVVRQNAFDKETEKLLHDLDDTANPQTTGRPIPPSSTQEPDRRARATALLRDKGLAFVAIDEATYASEGMALLRLAFADITAEDHHFEDGTGVTVLVLKPKE